MVPRDLFDKMSALALVAIVLVAILSLEAFAAEIPYQDSGVALEESEGPGRPAAAAEKLNLLFEVKELFILPRRPHTRRKHPPRCLILMKALCFQRI